MNNSVVALSSSSNQDEALFEVLSQIESKGVKPKLIIVFSEQDMFGYCVKKISEAYPNTVIIGATTYVSFCSEGYSHSGLSVMAIDGEIECSYGLLFDVSSYPAVYKSHITQALNKLSSYENTCCLEFTTAFSNAEDLVLDTFQEALEGKNIPVVGASAGSKEVGNQKTFVCLNGDIFANTCAFVFIHNLNGRINIIRENIFKPTNNVFMVTDVDCDEQLVYEYDRVPASDQLVNKLGIELDELPSLLETHPMGRLVDNDIFITASNKIFDDGSISYYSRIYNHTKMVFLEVDDIPKVWKETLNKSKKEIKNPSFVVALNCIGRALLFEKNNIFGDFVDNLRNVGKFIGISGYGEQLETIHLNQSMILVIFE